MYGGVRGGVSLVAHAIAQPLEDASQVRQAVVVHVPRQPKAADLATTVQRQCNGNVTAM